MQLNKIICWIFLAVLFSQVCAQDSLRIMNPVLGDVPDLSDSVKAEFEFRDKVFDKMDAGVRYSDLSPEEKAVLQKHPESFGSMWDIIGDGCSWYCGGGPSEVRSSSHLKAHRDIIYDSESAHDLSFKTAWVEGADGYGVGEYLEYRFENNSPRITQIIIYNGYIKSERIWEANSRVKTLKMLVNDSPFALLHLEDTRAAQKFDFEPLGRLEDGSDLVLRFEIVDVYPGSKYQDTAITELYFDGLDVHCFVAGTRITLAGGKTIPIEAVRPGDRVMSYDPLTGQVAPQRVTEVAAAWHCQLVRYTFSDGTVLTATRDHPLWISGSGWASLSPEQSQRYAFDHPVRRIRKGDAVLRFSNATGLRELYLTRIELVHEAQETYTISGLEKGSSFLAEGIVTGSEPWPAKNISQK